ncbi:MAG: CBS domain-containing protein [Pseudomonadota bacterium]
MSKFSTKQFLDSKGRVVYRIEPDKPVLEALKIMADKNIGALVVQDAQGRLVGMLSERDYARKVILEDKTSAATPVRDIMTAQVISVTEEHSLDDCLNIMSKHNIRHLPVVKYGKVVGVLGIGELVQQKMQEKEEEIESLGMYIAGGLPYR